MCIVNNIGDVSPKETRKKSKDGKGQTNIDASSKNTDVVSTESDSHGIYKETVSGIAQPQITKTTRVKRKRSRSSMSAASDMLLEQSDDGDNKKCKSIDSSTCRRENDVTNKVIYYTCVSDRIITSTHTYVYVHMCTHTKLCSIYTSSISNVSVLCIMVFVQNYITVLQDSHHKQKKRQSLPNFPLPSDNILLLEDNAHDHQRV